MQMHQRIPRAEAQCSSGSTSCSGLVCHGGGLADDSFKCASSRKSFDTV